MSTFRSRESDRRGALQAQCRETVVLAPSSTFYVVLLRRPSSLFACTVVSDLRAPVLEAARSFVVAPVSDVGA